MSRQSPVVSRQWAALLIPLLLLAACATPTTKPPTYTQQELAAEQRAQREVVQQAKGMPAFNDKKTYSEEEVGALAVRLGPIALRVERAANSVCHNLQGPASPCSYKLLLDEKERGLNAHADGKNVVINPAMVEFARNDTHLAFVIAHEFAHNIMRHIEAQKQNVGIGGLLGTLADVAAQSQGYQTQGAFGKLGANQALLRYSPSFEAEADYVGLYILAHAGYPIEEAPNFWRLMSVAEPNAIYVTSTHPNNPSRTIEMEKTVREIRTKQQQGLPLLPTIRKKH